MRAARPLALASLVLAWAHVPPPLPAPIVCGTREADRLLATMRLLPADSAWYEDVSARPVHPDSAAIVSSIGRDLPLDFNLDMTFAIVPGDQPRVPVEVTMYPSESDPGPFPIPAEAPIENWPLARNEDTGALPRPGQSLRDFQANGTGDRHLIVIDPFGGRLHEFWEARRTERGWRASQASTFDLTGRTTRPAGWTSADAAGLPIYPAIVRWDEVAAGRVGHALRVTVERSRRAHVPPASHHASPSHDPALPRMGERLRLRRDFETKGFPPHARVILEALQRHGMIVADNGGSWRISISPDRRFEGLESLLAVRGRDFEVVSAP